MSELTIERSPYVLHSGWLARPGARQQAWRTLRRSRLGLAGLVILATIATTALAAPWLAPHDPYQGSLTVSRQCPALTVCPNLGGSFARTGPTTGTTEYVLGTDVNGRDILSRIIYAARISLLVGVFAAAIGGSLGVLAGLLSGYYGGALDAVITRVADARIVRGQVLSARNQEYVIAARMIGARDPVILFRHLLPNVITPAIIIATFGIAAAIIGEATLSYLGVGIQPPTPTWGNMLADGRAYVASAWWLATFPGLAIMVTVLSINMIGDWLRDFLDPRLRHIG